jgi:hypothetical protein
MSEKKQLTAGQVLYLVPYQRYQGQPRDTVVTKVGRKWAYIENDRYRIDLATLVIDCEGGTSLGRCYVDKERYLADQEKQSAWDKLRQGIQNRYAVPANVTIETIRAAAESLGVSLSR